VRNASWARTLFIISAIFYRQIALIFCIFGSHFCLLLLNKIWGKKLYKSLDISAVILSAVTGQKGAKTMDTIYHGSRPMYKHRALTRKFTIFLNRLIPESPRWLIAHNHLDEAHKVLMRFGGKDGKLVDSQQLRTLIKEILEDQTARKNVDKKYTIIDLFRTPKLRKRMTIMCLQWYENEVNQFGRMKATSVLLRCSEIILSSLTRYF